MGEHTLQSVVNWATCLILHVCVHFASQWLFCCCKINHGQHSFVLYYKYLEDLLVSKKARK